MQGRSSKKQNINPNSQSNVYPVFNGYAINRLCFSPTFTIIMKSLAALTDPVYVPKSRYNLYEKFWLRIMNDKRDLPFIYLLTTIHLLVLPLAILLFTPVLNGWWWWTVAIPYFYIAQFYFKGRFGLMFHCLCHRRSLKLLTKNLCIFISPGSFALCLAMPPKAISAIIWGCII
jgi:hypothetical protein